MNLPVIQNIHSNFNFEDKINNQLAGFDNRIKLLYESKMRLIHGSHSDTIDLFAQRELIDAELRLVIERDFSFKTEINKLKALPEGITQEALKREFRRLETPLPFYSYRPQILKSLVENDVLVIHGQTGSGKSTQVPQYILEAGLAEKRIVCIEPRKIAAISLAKRISKELDVTEDTIVTYKIGGLSKRTAKNTMDKLIIMTDKLLFNEYKHDKMLNDYSCVIIDEAHERTLYTDIMLCELKKLVELRRRSNNPLKLIIMSATIDEEKFSRYFNSCPVIPVPGVMHHVEIRYEKMRSDYLEHTISRVQTIIENKEKNPGDILVFLPSGDDINQAIKRTSDFLKSKSIANNYEIFGLKGSMDREEQEKLFLEYEGKSKVIFSTNVAEMSVTIDGVRVIVDSGRVKQMVYDQERNISLLKLALISQSSAIQRKGRAGRTSSGICYRLYDKTDYENMEPILKPEIQRMHLGQVILQAMSTGIANVLEYDFIDRPDAHLLASAMDKLKSLKLVVNNQLTAEGRLAAELHLEPSIACILIEAIKKNCQDDLIKIISMMTVSSRLFESKTNKQDRSEKIVTHSDVSGDFLTMLRLYNEFSSFKTISQKNKWCSQNHFAYKAFDLADTTRTELDSILSKITEQHNDRVSSGSAAGCENNVNLSITINECVCAGLHTNLAYYNGRLKDGTKVYRIPRLNQEAFMDYSSCMLGLAEADANTDLLLFSELHRTDKLYMRNLMPISIEILRKYSNQDYTWLNKEIKKQVSIENVNPYIIKMIDNEWIESLEREIGYHVYKKKNMILTEVPVDMEEKARRVIQQSLDLFQDRKKRELFEFEPDGQQECRIIFGSGFKVKSILLDHKCFLRLNLDNLSPRVTDDDLYNSFINRYGNLLDWRVFKSSLNPTTNGYIVFESAEMAAKALREMHDFNLKGTRMRLSPSKTISKKSQFKNSSLIVTWNLAEPSGRVALNLDNSNPIAKQNLELALRRDNITVISMIDKEDPTQIRLKLENVTVDETEFKEKYSRYVKFEKLYFERKKVSNYSTDAPLDLIQASLASYFCQFGPINGDIDFLPFYKTQYGEIKERCTVYVRYMNPGDTINAMNQTNRKMVSELIILENLSYGYGRVDAKVQYKEDYQVPSKAIDLLAKDIKRLEVILSSEYNCILKVADEPDKYDKKMITLRTFSSDQFAASILLANQVLKPKTLYLSFIKYERLRKLLSDRKDELRLRFLNNHSVFISLDKRFKQVSLYGPKTSQEIVHDQIEQLLEKEIVNSRTIHIQSFRALFADGGRVYEELKLKYIGDYKIDFKNKTMTFSSRNANMKELERAVNDIQNSYLKIHRKTYANNRLLTPDTTCSICSDSLEDPLILLACSHKFCSDCIKNQFKCTDISMNVACVTCNTDLCILDIRRIADFNEELISDKANIMLGKELMANDKHAYCKVCNQIGQLEFVAPNKVMNCEARCKKKYCYQCEREVHGSLTCEQQKTKDRRIDEDLFEKYKRKYTKPCPHCRAPIEKNEGCNKIHCTACNKYMCWICQKGFQAQQETYDHINKDHTGKLFEVPPE